MDFRAMSKEVAPEVIELRHDFHQHPEASMAEFRTTDRIAEELDKMGIPYRRFDPTGLIATIQGGQPCKTVALRADIDALSITETADVPFKSQNEGFMHACGHDTHAAMLLGAAMILNKIKDQLKGTVKLLVQPAEEVATGAKLAIAQGALEGVDMIFGIHIAGQVPAGVVAICPGSSCSAADIFKIKIIGSAGHGAQPEATRDATVAAAALVMNLQTIVSRELPPTQPVVVTVGKLVSGSRFNIVSGEAYMEGTCRSFDPELHHKLPGIMERIAKETAATFRCEAEVEYHMMTEPLVNDPEALELVKQATAKIVDKPEMLVISKPQMGAEDFAEYSVHTQAAFAMVGGGSKEPNHSDHIVFDEDSFRTGVALHCQVAYDYLNGQN